MSRMWTSLSPRRMTFILFFIYSYWKKSGSPEAWPVHLHRALCLEKPHRWFKAQLCLPWNFQIIFVKWELHFRFENYAARLVWKRASGKQSQLIKFKPHILSLNSLTANTSDGNTLQKWFLSYKISIAFKFQKFTRFKHKRFFVFHGDCRQIVGNVKKIHTIIDLEYGFKLCGSTYMEICSINTVL